MWIAVLLVLVCACASHTSQIGDDAPAETYHADSKKGGAPSCKGMLDDYCTQLYSPESSGNLLIDRGVPIQILQGDTHNQFSHSFFRYSQTKLRNREKFPKDFRESLDRHSYFELLDEHLHRKVALKMSVEEKAHSVHLDIELNALWQSAIEETVLKRMSNRVKGFHQIPDRLVPVEYELEQRRVRRRLISEISRVLWREDQNWRRVVDGFHDLQQSYYTLIARLPIEQKLRDDWTGKIRDLELVLPGSRPEISDEECSTTTMNAYYYKYLNVITVCAGDFNSEDIVLTLAHEMAHALGVDRDLYLFLQSSTLGREVSGLRTQVCMDGPGIRCDDWSKFKTSLGDNLQALSSYKPPLPEFNRCLKKITSSKSPQDSDYERLAQSMTDARVANLATGDIFLRMIKNKLPMRNGQLQPNPNYFNPCSYYLWSKGEEPVDDEIFTLVYFAAEYACTSGDPLVRLKGAIETARRVSAQVQARVLRAEGEFSERSEVVAEALGAPPFERFADLIGSYAVAEYLQHNKDVNERRSKFLASASWLCQEPSLQTKYPEESHIEKLFTLEAHTQGEERKYEILSAPMREALTCEKDFTFGECTLGP